MKDENAIRDVVEEIAFQINHSFPDKVGYAAGVGTIYQEPYSTDLFRLLYSLEKINCLVHSDYFREQLYGLLIFNKKTAPKKKVEDLFEVYCNIWDRWCDAIDFYKRAKGQNW